MAAAPTEASKPDAAESDLFGSAEDVVLVPLFDGSSSSPPSGSSLAVGVGMVTVPLVGESMVPLV